MTKYEVYAEGDNRPIKKTRREYEAIGFACDLRNLARYGCLTLIREADDGSVSVWDNLDGTWKPSVEDEASMEGYI